MVLNLSDYDFDLPEELIAKEPLPNRSDSRLLVVNREKGSLAEQRFSDLTDLLTPDHLLFFNNSKVIKARLFGKKGSGAAIELLLLKERGEFWEVLLKPGRKCPPGTEIHFSETFSCIVLEDLDEGKKLVRFSTSDFWNELETHGEIPLPHYMNRKPTAEDEKRYQTVYAGPKGSVAAPTAGLHFTPELIDTLEKRGIHHHTLTLHVGWGTFKPVQTERISDHRMHSERYSLREEVKEAILSPTKKRLAVGTTSVRVMESCEALQGETSIFIYPGYRFKRVDSLITNFHLPRSSLLMLVSAFGGYELIQEAYHFAISNKFRFYSYGDSMLII